MGKRCDLYLRLRADTLPPQAELEALLREAKPAALLLMGLPDAASMDRLRQAIEPESRQTLAILIENDSALAKKLRADGVHLRGKSGQLADARRLLGEDSSIGVSSVLSRHEAMILAEAGADYIAFGDPGLSERRDLDALADMISWWDELFEVPCVAWLPESGSEEDARSHIRAGADFLSVDAGIGDFDERSAFIRNLAAITRNFEKTA